MDFLKPDSCTDLIKSGSSSSGQKIFSLGGHPGAVYSDRQGCSGFLLAKDEQELHMQERTSTCPCLLSTSLFAALNEAPAGFCLIPAALSVKEQQQLAKDCLVQFTEPPSHTNHTKAHGGLTDLWQAARAGALTCFCGNSIMKASCI